MSIVIEDKQNDVMQKNAEGTWHPGGVFQRKIWEFFFHGVQWGYWGSWRNKKMLKLH